MKIVDTENWSRKNQYQNFIGYSNPIVSVCTTIDITQLVLYCKMSNRSFFSTFLYVVSMGVNHVDEMKLRLLGDQVVMHDIVHPSFVVLCENDELRTCTTCFDTDFESFYRKNREDINTAKNKRNFAYNESIQTDCFYLSCLPWITINSVANPYNLSDKAQSSIPRITWGKYYQKNQSFEINFDISAHHALVDGVHIARVIKEIERHISKFNIMEETNEG